VSGVIRPQWDAPARVRALMTTRAAGDMASGAARAELRGALPGDPVWLRQVHGIAVADLDCAMIGATADAAVTRASGRVCAVQVADCMPVLLADQAGTVVAAVHAGWRGLCAGVLEATLDAMRLPGHEIVAWLGPAIGPRVYEVGDEVRAAFIARQESSSTAFRPTRPGHWLLDLYAVARQRLLARGTQRILGGGFCTYYSYRRDGATGRMAALIWLA
jgi:YfiH family protein